jgi:Amt family ammonium transporter
MPNWMVVAASVAATIVVLVSLAIVDARMLPASPWRRSVLVSLACAAAGVIAWVVVAPLIAPQVLGDLFLSIGALAGVGAYLATIAVRAGGGGVVATIVFALVWSAVVFVPTAVLTFAPFATGWLIGVHPVDHGGSLAVNVAAGAAALGVLLTGGPRLRTATIRRTTAVVAVVTLCLGWLAWLVGAELAIDDVTPSILLHGLVGAAGGVVGWLVVQRMSHKSTTLAAVAGGLVSGLVAVTAGAPLLTPLSAAAAGILAGGAACIFTLRRVGASRRQQWFVVGSHLIAGAVGIVVLGLLADGMGFLYTGSIALIQNQIVGTVLVAVYSTAVSVVLWMPLRWASSRFARSRAAVALPT